MRTTYAAAIEPRLDDIVPPLLALFEAPVGFQVEIVLLQCLSTCLPWPTTGVEPDRLAAKATGKQGSGNGRQNTLFERIRASSATQSNNRRP